MSTALEIMATAFLSFVAFGGVAVLIAGIQVLAERRVHIRGRLGL